MIRLSGSLLILHAKQPSCGLEGSSTMSGCPTQHICSFILQSPSTSSILSLRKKDFSFDDSVWSFINASNDSSRSLDNEEAAILLRDQLKKLVKSPSDETFKFEPKNLLLLGSVLAPPYCKVTRRYDVTFYYLSTDTVDKELKGKEFSVESQWLKPSEAVDKWNRGELVLSPFALYIFRLLCGRHSDPKAVQKAFSESASLPELFRVPLEFYPGISLIPIYSDTLHPFENTNLAVFESEGERLIVDPGSNQKGNEDLARCLKSFSKPPKVFITHHHRDHVMGLPVVESIWPTAEVLAHPQTLQRIKTQLKTVPIKEEEIVVGKMRLQAITSPGHTDGHLALWHPASKTLVAGDHVVGVGSAVLDPNCGDMSDYFDSTKKFISMGPRLVIPAHGPPSHDPIRLLETYLKHRQIREDAILQCWTVGKRSPDEIVHDVYAETPANLLELAKRNVELHIKKLKKDGKIVN